MKNKKVMGVLLAATVAGGVIFSSNAAADNVQLAINPSTTVLYMKSNIYQGGITNMDDQNIYWGYLGDVYAAVVNPATGEQSSPAVKIGTVEGAPAFPKSFMALGDPTYGGDPKAVAAAMNTETLPWTCTSCTLKIGGSEFHRIPNMSLTGRAFIGLGAVANKEGYLALRMAGCAGVQEVSGLGKYANKMGTICLNGTIGFKQDFSGVGTSNCVLVLQDGPYTPVVPEQQ